MQEQHPLNYKTVGDLYTLEVKVVSIDDYHKMRAQRPTQVCNLTKSALGIACLLLVHQLCEQRGSGARPAS